MERRAAASGGGEWWRGAVGACTESLGSETGDAGGYADADIINWLRAPSAAAEDEATVEEPDLQDAFPSPKEEGEKKGGGRARRGLCLPPVMPRAAEALVMRAERSGGRLILTEVPADELSQRRVVFRASRDGGRLQLCFAKAASGGGGGGGVGVGSAAAAAASAAPEDGGAGEPEEAREQVGTGECCQVAAAGRGRVEVGAVVGI
ncbi:unnamed protein product [Urochloa humidicola]